MSEDDLSVKAGVLNARPHFDRCFFEFRKYARGESQELTSCFLAVESVWALGKHRVIVISKDG